MPIAKTSRDQVVIVQLSMDGNPRTCCAGRRRPSMAGRVQ